MHTPHLVRRIATVRWVAAVSTNSTTFAIPIISLRMILPRPDKPWAAAIGIFLTDMCEGRSQGSHSRTAASPVRLRLDTVQDCRHLLEGPRTWERSLRREMPTAVILL
jgi:hypothetical protein